MKNVFSSKSQEAQLSAAYIKVWMLPVQVRWLAHWAGISGTFWTFHMPLLLALIIFPFHPNCADS